MAAYPAEITSEETALLERLTGAFPGLLGNGAPVLEWDIAVDHSRGGAYVMVSATASPPLMKLVYRGDAIHELREMDPSVSGVYIAYSPKEGKLRYALDIARANIDPDDVQPFSPPPAIEVFDLTAAERSKFANENRAGLHGRAQLSLAEKIYAVWIASCPALLGGHRSIPGSITAKDCSVPNIKCTKAPAQHGKMTTARAWCSVHTTADVGWSMASLKALEGVSRYVRTVDLHLEIRSDDVLVTAVVHLATPDARSADWTSERRRSVRAPSVAPQLQRTTSFVAQNKNRANLKKDNRRTYVPQSLE